MDGPRGNAAEEAAVSRSVRGGSVLVREEIGIPYEKDGSSSRRRSERDSERESEERQARINIYTVRRDNSEAVIKLVCHISFHYRAWLACK